MERWMDMLRGQLMLRAEGARTEELLNLCSAYGIAFWEVRRGGAFQLRLTVLRRDKKRVDQLAQRCGCTITTIRERGIPMRLRFLHRRVALCISALLVLGMLFWSSLYIWKIEVKGNESVPTGDILNALDDCGVGIGSFWPAFTSDNIRSRVLTRLPDLRWITVNVNGSCAEVIVRERTPAPELYQEKNFADIEAVCGGVVEEVLALNGVALVKKGDTVAEGDVLISGEAENLMEQTRYIHALGSVRARTWHTLTAACPLETSEKGEAEASTWRFALGISEELLKFYPNSGIPPGNCGKIVKELTLGIVDVYTLPVTLRAEHLEKYALQTVAVDTDAAAERLMSILMDELSFRIGADGEVCSHTFSINEEDGLLLVTLRAECLQEIGVTTDKMP